MTCIFINTADKNPDSCRLDKNFIAIMDALDAAGFWFSIPYATFTGVSVSTKAPREFIESLEYTRSAVDII
jgi:hypothetical protein